MTNDPRHRRRGLRRLARRRRARARGLCAGRARQLLEQHARRAAAPAGAGGPPGARGQRRRARRGRRCARVFHDHPIAGVVHCAGLKAVGESEERPLAYYDVNVGGAIALAEVMGEAGVATLVFSSSATVYGQPDDLPVTEDAPLRPQQRLRPHQARRRGLPARSRARERQLAHRDPALLQSGRRASTRACSAKRRAAGPPISCRCCAGSRPASSPTSRSTAATGPRPTAPAFATTCTSQDLAEGHVAALRYLAEAHGALTLNLGAGRGHSVLEVIAAFEKRLRAQAHASTIAPRGAPAMSRRTTPTRRARRSCSAGARRAISTRSAPMRGAGRRTAAGTRRWVRLQPYRTPRLAEARPTRTSSRDFQRLDADLLGQPRLQRGELRRRLHRVVPRMRQVDRDVRLDAARAARSSRRRGSP